MENIVTVPAGEVVGIGKIKAFQTKDFPYEIPTLSFIVAKTKDGRFVASCLQMVTNGEGDSENDAIENMKNHCLNYLRTIFSDEKTDPWDILRGLFTEPMEEYWTAYRTIQLKLAKNGINTDFLAEHEKRIQQLQEELDAYKKSGHRFQFEIVSYQKAA